MMNSPFLRNRQRKLAAAAGDAAKIGTAQPRDEKTQAGQEYASLKVRLDEYLRQLADTASHEARVPMKAQFLGDFREWVDGVIEADAPVEDDIVMTSLVWAIDTGDFPRAVEIGRFALRHGLKMPERYNRSVATFLREDIAQIEIDDAGTVDLETLVEIDALTQGADMPDQAKAKLHKALGRAWRTKSESTEPTDDSAPAGGKAAFVAEALAQLRRALALDKKVGVKKDIERLEKVERDLKTEAEAASEGDDKNSAGGDAS